MSQRKKGKCNWVILMLTMFVMMAGAACGTTDSGGSGECPVEGDPGTQQRVGPFATQTTANERYREHQEAGCELSNGVFPCFTDDFIRGYCFNVFFD